MHEMASEGLSQRELCRRRKKHGLRGSNGLRKRTNVMHNSAMLNNLYRWISRSTLIRNGVFRKPVVIAKNEVKWSLVKRTVITFLAITSPLNPALTLIPGSARHRERGKTLGQSVYVWRGALRRNANDEHTLSLSLSMIRPSGKKRRQLVIVSLKKTTAGSSPKLSGEAVK